LEENERFERVLREKGPRAVEPKRFSRTSPNVPAGECAIAFGFTGPAIAVGGGPRAAVEALLVGSDLVAHGDADRVFVVLCDEVGPTTKAIFEAAGVAEPAAGARAVVFECATVGERAVEREAFVRLLASSQVDEAGDALFLAALSKAAGS
jgi:3-oxoacyl-(acyl-carrier-protein) synthase